MLAFGFNVILSRTKPIIPARREAIKIAIFELFTKSGSSKASRVIKIDMVKPIPAKNPNPITFFQFSSAGKAHTPIAEPAKTNKKIPSGFPNIRPAIIPIEFG